MDFSQFSTPSADWLQGIEANPRTPEIIIKDPRTNRDNWLATGIWKTIPVNIASKISIKTLAITGKDGHILSGRLYYPLSRPFGCSLLPLYFYIHGGGFLHGNLEASNFECARICSAIGVVVCHVDYRHTDICSYPTLYEDVWSSFKYAIEHAEEWGIDEEKIIVAGESAGANLAVGVCVRAVEASVSVKAMVLGSPFLCRPSFFPGGLIEEGKSSLEQHVEAPGPTRDTLEWFMDLLDPERNKDNYDVSPLLRPKAQWKGMPRGYVQIAGMDPLRDEAILWVKTLQEAGVDVEYVVYPGLPHAFHHTDFLSTSKIYDDDHDEEVRKILSFVAVV